MRHLLAFTLFLPLAAQAEELAAPGPVAFQQSVLATGLESPWELTWGPDDMLWVTERVPGRIQRIDPQSGAMSLAGTLDGVSAPGGQDGLLGMALHPDLLGGQPYVYAAMTYEDPARPADPTALDPRYGHLFTRIVRLTWDPGSGLLGDPLTLIDGLPAGQDHNSGRLKSGPDGMLYYTIGDHGHNQLANWCLPIEAQRLPTAGEVAAKDWIAYQGKSLRLAPDGGIPADNPILGGVQSHVFTYGHRNMQGIAFGPDGTLYASEHGPKADDEVNVLAAGGNYGWPHVSGYRDDMAYRYARWADASVPCASLRFTDLAIPASVPTEAETSWQEPFREPLATLFTVPSDHDFSDPDCGNAAYICWPTVAPSSIEVYRPEMPIPGFGNALLVTALKRGSIYRIPLTDDGQAAAGPPERYLRTENRYRDLAVSPDGQALYVATDGGGQHDTADGGVSSEVDNPGSILVFRPSQ